MDRILHHKSASTLNRGVQGDRRCEKHSNLGPFEVVQDFVHRPSKGVFVFLGESSIWLGGITQLHLKSTTEALSRGPLNYLSGAVSQFRAPSREGSFEESQRRSLSSVGCQLILISMRVYGSWPERSDSVGWCGLNSKNRSSPP